MINGCIQENELVNEPEDKKADSIVVSANYIPIDWDSTSIVDYNQSTGNVQLQFTENPPSIKNGSTFVLVVNDTTSSIRKVLNSSLNGSIYELQTEEGAMSDIFTSGSFTLSTGDATSEKAISFYPAKIGYSNGMVRAVPRGEISNKLLEVSIPLTQIKLWESPNTTSKFTYESGSLGISLNLLMEFNFNNKDELIEKVTGNLLELKVSMVGSLDVEYGISYTIDSKIEIGETEILKKKNIITPKFLWFNVQGVPVLIMVKSDLLADFQLSAEGKLNAKVGAHYNLTTKSGFEYNQKTNQITNFSENTKSIDVIPPTISGEATVNFKPSLYPRFYVYFYGLVGPTIDIKPYIDFTAKAKYLQSFLVNQTQFASMEFVTSIGLNLQSRLHYKPFNFKNNDDILMLDKDLINMEIFRSPHKIVKDTTTIKSVKSENKEVTFIVYDTLAYSQKIQPTSLPISVKISSINGEENKTLNENGAIVYEYDASTPSTIKASIFNVDGSQISIATHEIDEREMLIAFYKSTNGDNWIRNDNWCSDKPISEWYGVGIYGDYYTPYEVVNGRVSSITLPNNNLTGSAYLAGLKSIRRMDILEGNKIESLTIDNCRNEIPDGYGYDNNGMLYHYDFYNSNVNLKTLKISNTHTSVMINGNFSAESIVITDCNLSGSEQIYFNLPSTTVGTLRVSNCTMGYFYADNSIIGSITIENCRFLEDENHNRAYIYVGNKTHVNNCIGLRYISYGGPCSELIVTNTVCSNIYCGKDEDKND
jgi:hypothetical protein